MKNFNYKYPSLYKDPKLNKYKILICFLNNIHIKYSLYENKHKIKIPNLFINNL